MDPGAFVHVSADGTHFEVNGSPFYFAGANCYTLMVGKLVSKLLDLCPTDSFDEAAETMLSVWAGYLSWLCPFRKLGLRTSVYSIIADPAQSHGLCQHSDGLQNRTRATTAH